MLQGFLVQFTSGSMLELAALLTAKLVVQDVGGEPRHWDCRPAVGDPAAGRHPLPALRVIGDRLRRRSLRVRALIAAYGLWVVLPGYLALVWAPLLLRGAPRGISASLLSSVLQALPLPSRAS